MYLTNFLSHTHLYPTRVSQLLMSFSSLSLTITSSIPYIFISSLIISNYIFFNLLLNFYFTYHLAYLVIFYSLNMSKSSWCVLFYLTSVFVLLLNSTLKYSFVYLPYLVTPHIYLCIFISASFTFIFSFVFKAQNFSL